MAGRIAIVGNCQVFAFAACFRALMPEMSVAHFWLTERWVQENWEAIGEFLDDCDVVFAHPYNAHPMISLRADQLQGRIRRFQLLPNFVFLGYHPDIALFHYSGRWLNTHMNQYNSAIAAAGFLAGLSISETAELFNSYVYAKLGYFDFSAFKESFLDQAAASGYDLSELFDRWAAEGCFMHAITHPKIHVVADVAKLAARRGALEFDEDLALREVVVDPLDHIQWPVYPEIARRLHCEGSLRFNRGKAKVGLIEDDGDGVLSLEEYVTDCFRRYRDLPRTVFVDLPSEAFGDDGGMAFRRVDRILDLIG